MSDLGDLDAFAMSYDDLQAASEVVSLRFPRGSGEADRTANVRKLSEVSADLSYALSTFTHHVLVHSRRATPDHDLLAETAALQDALNSFGAQVRAMADTYRLIVAGAHAGVRQGISA